MRHGVQAIQLANLRYNEIEEMHTEQLMHKMYMKITPSECIKGYRN